MSMWHLIGGHKIKLTKICFRWRLLQCPLGIGSCQIIPRLFRSFSKSQMVCWTGRIRATFSTGPSKWKKNGSIFARRYASGKFCVKTCKERLFFFVFFNVGPHMEDIFLTTFYGLYFSHHYTYYKSQSVTYCCLPYSTLEHDSCRLRGVSTSIVVNILVEQFNEMLLYLTEL